MINLTTEDCVEVAKNAGYQLGYKDCMSEWLGLLRFHLGGLEIQLDSEKASQLLRFKLTAQKEYIEGLIKLRWNDQKVEVSNGASQATA